MASIAENLLAVLQKETALYQAFIRLADNKKDVIIRGDLPGLQQVTKQEEIVAGQLLRIERERQAVVEDICLVTNQKEESLTLVSIINSLDGQPIKQALEEELNNLTEVVKEANHLNQSNQQLIQESIDYLDFMMNAVQSFREVSTNNYAKKGRQDYSEKTLFDAKQ